MPKETSNSTHAKGHRASPATRPVKPKDPKASHLYTDDNPSTTLHGTGFKDAATARKTIALVSKRSLTYQFQTINTMYHRAKHHAHKTAGIEAAIDVFGTWLKETYPREKESMRHFKPLLSKNCVEGFLDRVREVGEVDARFAEVYVALEKGKRLANVLVNERKPGEADWERARYDALCELVPIDGGEKTDLWDGSGRPSTYHLQLIAWAWSPVGEKKLLAVKKR